MNVEIDRPIPAEAARAIDKAIRFHLVDDDRETCDLAYATLRKAVAVGFEELDLCVTLVGIGYGVRPADAPPARTGVMSMPGTPQADVEAAQQSAAFIAAVVNRDLAGAELVWNHGLPEWREQLCSALFHAVVGQAVAHRLGGGRR